jgi:glycosyltransferase involved in cell wall biosynthesis
MAGAGRRPRLLFLVTEDWYFWAHRRLLARAARDAGYEIVVATRVGAMGSRIAAEGFRLEPLGWVRGSRNPLRLVGETVAVGRLYRRLRPDLVHHVSLKPVVVGSLAALSCPGARMVNALTGLGYTFTSRRPSARLLAALLAPLLRLLLNRPRSIALLENEDDRRTLVARFGVAADRTIVNRGSGVDVGRFAPAPPPDNAVPVVGCAARMVGIKGIAELVEASRRLDRRGVPHLLRLAGAPDPENPDAIPIETLMDWARERHVEWLGPVDDVPGFWAGADIAALASHGGEGVPLSLVEAAAVGRPLVATDTPGCRDIVQDGRNGLLVPAHDPARLADALERLIADAPLRERMGRESLEIVRDGFSSDAVNALTLAVYERLLRGPGRGGVST